MALVMPGLAAGAILLTAVGDVDELVGAVELDEVLEHDSEKLRVQLGHTVHGVRANDGEPGHSDLLRRALYRQEHVNVSAMLPAVRWHLEGSP